MIGYTSRTGTLTTLAALRAAGWRLLVTPAMPRTEGMPYALDNGAWAARDGRVWDEAAFARMFAALGEGADWVAVPDVVADWSATRRLVDHWLPRLDACQQRLIPVQDGATPEDVRPYLGTAVGIFLGGSTEWKIATMVQWGHLSREVGCYYHVARVNTKRRFQQAQFAGAHSIDGTSPVQFPKNLPMLDRWLRAPHLWSRHA